MTRADRFILGSCGLAIVFSAVAGAALVARRPEVESWVTDAEARFRREQAAVKDPPPPVPRFSDSWARIEAGKERKDSLAFYAMPRFVEVPKPPHPDVTLKIHPAAVPGGGSASQDGASIRWTIEDPAVELLPQEKREAAKVEGFVVERSRDGKAFEKIAEAGPAARSYEDRTAEPRATYQYRVRVDGAPEAVTCGGCNRTIEVPRPSERRAIEVRTPSPYRVKLVGGDTKVGVFRVDAYDRRAKAWRGASHTARPGEEIGPSGWRLVALAFEKSSLAAEVVDDEAAGRKISTKD